MQNLQQLSAVVQRNCDIADAEYARNYSLCTYLLKMREYYRWERRLPLTAPLPRDDVGAWIVEREGVWDALENKKFECVSLNSMRFEPYDEVSINRLLAPEGLVYSGGVGRFGQPHFFLGQLQQTQKRDHFIIYISAREYARDLAAPPAMTRGRTIFIRRESLRRTLWELVDEWRWQKPPGPLAWVVEHYGFEIDPELAIHRMTDDEVPSVILHEVGEVMAGDVLGKAWDEMLAGITPSRAELGVRAVRDHLADCLSTLPTLLERGDAGPIHFYFANLRALRRELFPRAVAAYEHWIANGTLAPLRSLVPTGADHWQAMATEILRIYEQGNENLPKAIEHLMAQRATL